MLLLCEIFLGVSVQLLLIFALGEFLIPREPSALRKIDVRRLDPAAKARLACASNV